MKAFIALLACVCVSPALAADYLYDVSMPFYPGGIDNAGFIETNCDQCVLSRSNIVAWSFNQTNTAMGPAFGGATFADSALHGASVAVQGRGFVATPTALSFDFTSSSHFSDVLFSSGGNAVHYTNSPDFLAVSSGWMEDCSNAIGQCAGMTYDSVAKVGSRAATVGAPELSATGIMPSLTLLLGTLAVLGGRIRRLSHTASRR